MTEPIKVRCSSLPMPKNSRFIDLTGKLVGRLTVIHYAGKDHESNSLWFCRCLCGTELLVVASRLTKANTKSCGCLQADSRATATRVHGLCRSAEYGVWSGMIQRCTNPKRSKFKRYGARGIKVCTRWLESFESFLTDMGNRPSSRHTIERKNNDGDYEPGNCVWIVKEEQAKNSSLTIKLTFNGETLCMSDWARRVGILPSRLSRRLKDGWSLEDALTTPPAQGQKAKQSSSDAPACP